MLARERLIDTARQVFRSFGFVPIDTPALEYLEILSGKGGEESDKQLYKFQDHGGRWVGLRFDLTVPLARFAAQHLTKLGLPIKRYHIATVWRGENTQRGRFREFMQCDFDAIGVHSTAADAEIVLVINDLLTALGFQEFTIRLNNRLILSGLLERLGLADKATTVLRVLDKLGKVGAEEVESLLVSEAGASASQAAEIKHFAQLAGENESLLHEAEPLVGRSAAGAEGIKKLSELLSALLDGAGLPPERLKIDFSIARGLDYYTGSVFETYLDRLPDIGSVCSGGRYDSLAGLFTSEELPGVGASLGVDRLLAAMEELHLLEKPTATAPVFIPFFEKDRLQDYLRLAAALRRSGIGVELYPEPVRLDKQLKYADRRGFRLALIIGEKEFQTAQCQVKDLKTRGRTEVALDAGYSALISAIKQVLAC